MNILVSMGSYKDVFTPIETTCLVAGALNSHSVISAPMCDGGEYTYDVLKFHKDCTEINVKSVYNAYGKLVESRYLVYMDEAYIVSSEIIRLSPTEEKYKNPLFLSDYGLGQLCLDAINRGYKTINLCLGGTSTVCFGMGFAQALGVNFYDCSGTLITSHITPKELLNVERIESHRRWGVDLKIINDGVTSALDMAGVNPQKIGKDFCKSKQDILSKLDNTLYKVCSLTGVDINTPYAGNGGGVCFGAEILFKPHYLKGTDYFITLFGLKEKMMESDLIITGEGKLDNIHTEKLPVSICLMSMKYNKKSLFICGQKGDDVSPELLQKYGINDLICCSDYYHELENECLDNIETYKKLTPVVIERELIKRYA